MKRTLTITLTVALVGGLMFMGFAGTAAAQDITIDAEAITGESGDATNTADVDQTNNNAQVGLANAEAAAVGADDGHHAPHHDHYKGDKADGNAADTFAVADASVTQAQDVDQANAADVDQTATTGDAAGIGVDIDVDLDVLADGEA